jgi:hypothetical protein
MKEIKRVTKETIGRNPPNGKANSSSKMPLL